MTGSGPTRNAVQAAMDFVFGFDYFISYGHRDGNNYPKRLKERLQQAGFKVFLDLSEYAAGTDLRRDTVRQVNKSRKLIIVARPGALASEWVKREMDVALLKNKIPLIININSAIEDSVTTSVISKIALNRQWLTLNENLDRPDGEPSDNAIAELVRGFKNTRQETKRLRILEAASVVLAVTTAAAVWQSFVAVKNERLALRERDVAIANESRALVALSKAANLKGSYADAVMLAIAAWPRAGDEERPLLQQTIDALSEALPRMRERARLENKSIQDAQFIPGTDSFVLRPSKGPLEIWNASNWTRRMRLGSEQDAFRSMRTIGGVFLGAAMKDGSLRTYDLSSGKLLASVKAHSGEIDDIAFSPDGQSLVTTSDDKSAKVWSARTLELITPLAGHKDIIGKAEFAPNGKSLLTVGTDGVVISDATTGAVIANIAGDSYDRPRSATFLGMGDQIATVWWRGAVKVSEARSGRDVATFDDCLHASTQVFPSPDRSHFLLACDSKGVIYDSKSLTALAKIAGPSVAAEAAFSPDNSLLATAAWNGVGELWDGATGEKIGDLTGHTDGIVSIDVSVHHDVITASPDGTVRLWNPVSPRAQVLGRFGDQNNMETALTSTPALSIDGKELLFIGRGDIQILSLDNLEEHDLTADGTLIYARFCQGSNSVVAIEYLGDLLLISNPDSQTIARVKEKTTAASCSPKGDIFAAGDEQGRIRLFDAKTGSPMQVLGQVSSDAKVADIAFSRDGAFVAAAAGGTVKIWKLNSAVVPAVAFDDASSREKAIQYSPDGLEIAVTGDIGVPTKVFDAATGQLKFRLLDASEIHHSVSFSPDGKFIITPRGKTATVWDAVTGAALSSYGSHNADVIWSSFAPGNSILTVSLDGEARIWTEGPLETGDAFHVACQRLLNTGTLDSLARGFGLIDIKPICATGLNQYLPASLDRDRLSLVE